MNPRSSFCVKLICNEEITHIYSNSKQAVLPILIVSNVLQEGNDRQKLS